jgi:ribosomal protein S12 methylthiotransferase
MCPDITIRSTFIVGFPGETEEDFELLLDWMRETKIERAGCFKYENVKGARSAELENHVPEEIKQERWDRFMQVQQEISAANMASKVGQTTQVLVDEYDDENNIYIARSKADAPEIDGNVFIENFDNNKIKIGDFATVKITDNSEYDLYADQT